MSRGLGYLCIVLVTLTTLALDFVVLTSSAIVSRIAAHEIEDAFGRQLTFGQIQASISGNLTLRQVALYATPKRFRVLSADCVRVDLQTRAGMTVPHEILLEDPRLTLDQAFFEYVAQAPASRPLRELYPPDALPRVRCIGGQLDVIFPQFFLKAHTFAIRELALVPVSGYRYFAGGKIRSPLFGEWTLSGSFDLETGAVHVLMTCAEAYFGSPVRDMLAPDLRTTWDRYQPEGNARIAIQVDADPQTPVRVRTTVIPIGMSLCYAGFPYRIEGIQGELDFTADGFVVKHLTGHRGDTVIRFDGSAQGYTAESAFDFRVEIDGMCLDERLRAALKPQARTLYDKFQPAGVVDARGRVTREAGPDKEVRNPLDICFRTCSFRFLPFPYDFSDVQGTLFIDGSSVRLHHATARHGAASFELTGTLDHLNAESGTEPDPRVDLRIRGQGLVLDSTLKHALPDEPKRVWEDLDLSGTVDVDWHVTKKPGEKEVHSSEVELRSVRLTPRDIPLPVSKMTGHISYTPEAIRFNHLAGELEEGSMTLNGVHQVSEKGSSRSYDISASGVRINDRFRRAMPKTIADLLDALKVSGQVNAQIHFETTKTNDQEESFWHGRIDLRQASFEAPITFTNVEGVADFRGSTRGGKTTGEGLLNFQEALIQGKKIQDLTASFYYDDQQVRFRRLRGIAYGGTLEGRLAIHRETSALEGELTVKRLDLNAFLRDIESLSNIELAGKADLEMRDFAGNAKDRNSLTGSGSLLITEGKLLADQARGILTILNPLSATKSFEAGKILFTISGGKFRISQLGFVSDRGNSSLVGKGTVDFSGHYRLRIKATPEPLFGIDFFLFQIPSAILGQVMRTVVEGDLSSDVVKTEESDEGKD